MLYSRTFTGAWIETLTVNPSNSLSFCRTFTGAWIETSDYSRQQPLVLVAPSRVRGLKQINYQR